MDMMSLAPSSSSRSLPAARGDFGEEEEEPFSTFVLRIAVSASRTFLRGTRTHTHTHILGFPKLRGVLQRRASLAALCTRPKLLIIGIWANLRATRLLLSLMGEDAADGRILVCELRIGSSVFTYNCVCVSVSFHQKNFLLIDQCCG